MYVHAYVHRCDSMRRRAKDDIEYLPQLLFYLLLWGGGLSLSLEFTDSARMASQKTVGILLSLLP